MESSALTVAPMNNSTIVGELVLELELISYEFCTSTHVLLFHSWMIAVVRRAVVLLSFSHSLSHLLLLIYRYYTLFIIYENIACFIFFFIVLSPLGDFCAYMRHLFPPVEWLSYYWGM